MAHATTCGGVPTRGPSGLSGAGRQRPQTRVTALGGTRYGLSPEAEQLLAQLASGSAGPGGSSASSILDSSSSTTTTTSTATAAWQQLEPHFGSRLASQLMQRAGTAMHQGVQSGMPQLPTELQNVQLPNVQLPGVQLPSVQLPSVQLPSVQLPSVQLPNVQVPSVQLPNVQVPDGGSLLQGVGAGITSTSAAAAGAADSLAHAPQQVQQQLELLQQQLQDLGSADGSSLEPHFGSHALQSWLQAAGDALAGALHLPGSSLAVLGSLGGSSSLGLEGFGGPAASLDASLAALRASLQALSANLAASLPEQLSADLAQALAGLQQQLGTAGDGLQQLQASLLATAAALQQLPDHGAGGYSFPTLCFVAAGALAALAASVPPADAVAGGADDIRDALSHEYDPEAVGAYFSRRPVQVAQRSLQLALEAARFGVALLGDLATNRLQANEPARAVQLRAIIERLGPAYVKVAQALSTRVDLLSPQYFAQIQMLQDRVPPFPCDQAKEAMSAAFGRPTDAVFAYLSPRPVAAASLGQVYRGKLVASLGGREVAVKVQRPGVLEQVCLDLHLMRRMASAISAMPDVNTDWAALIDSWAVRFLHEMDYEREAANAALFRQQMADADVKGIVTADVLPDLSNDVVLTTAWANGEKLSESRASDVRELCNTLLSAYLIQLLDTGTLHADPHPGNLIRTEDGKICVLDFGLMTEVTPKQRIALFEYIAHLSIQDWEKVAYDLQALGFIPDDVGDEMLQEMAQPLGSILVQLSGGGGATKLNIDAVMAELETLGSSYPFSIPPFFALILRAFSVIEGIALTVDPDYSIVQECFPYLARRLLADDDPRVRQALRDVLYGGKTRLDVDRLIRLSDAFSAYTVDGLAPAGAAPPIASSQLAPPGSSSSATAAAAAAARPAPAPAALSPAARDALLAVFSRRGSYVQELLVEELVAAADALSREVLSGTLRLVLGSAPVAAALSSLEAAGPLRPLLLPFTGPLELAARLAPVLALTPEDEEALGVVRGIFQLVQRLQPDAPTTTTTTAAGVGTAGPLGAAGAGAGASGMVFSTTAAAGGRASTVGGLPVPLGQQPLDGRSTVAAAVEAVSGAAGVAQELSPLLPELLPGLSHTGQLFAAAFVRRVAQRAAESFALPGSGLPTPEQQEEALAMAALGFMPRPMGLPGQGAVPAGSGLPLANNSAAAWAPAPLASSAPSSANGFGVQQGPWGRQPEQQQQQQLGGSSGGAQALLGAVSRSMWGRRAEAGPMTAGELVTGLAAAPLLLVLTPLALLNEMQRQQQQQGGRDEV